MNAVTPAFWRNRKVFITGHTGFKGSWLATLLLEMGAQVRGYALAPKPEGVPDGFMPLFDVLELDRRMDHVIGDVRDARRLREELAAFAPEIVLHLAAQPLVKASYRSPVQTFETNVMGTVHLLDGCRSLPGLRALVVVTSDKCYENRESHWGYRESDPMGGHDPYSSSKGCAELVTTAYRGSFFPADRHSEHGVTVASARAGNVIGGGDWSADRLLPDVMRSYHADRTTIIRHPSAVRPWQHVLEPLRGYLMLAEACVSRGPEVGHGWNFGPSDGAAATVAEVLDRISAAFDGAIWWQQESEPPELHEAVLLTLDCTLARTGLGWRPVMDLGRTVGMTADWYLHRGPDAIERQRHVVLSQIHASLPE
jgi:CDP-glucose 4,6-dehydratase